MRSLRANHDVKLIMNGAEMCVLVLYTTNYAFKKQTHSSNVSTLIADRLIHHEKQESGEQDVQTYNKHLVQQCANVLLTQREFSGPEVISYLMSWGDHFESHGHVLVFLDSTVWALRQTFAQLNQR